MPFASVIPTAAPRKFFPFRKSLARSGGIPREYPPQCCFREVFPDCQSEHPGAKTNDAIGVRGIGPVLPSSTRRNEEGEPGPWPEERPLAAWSRMDMRELATPLHRFLV